MKIILEQKCPFNNGTSQQLSDNHSFLRLIVWKGQHPFIAISEEFHFNITRVLLENVNVTQPANALLLHGTSRLTADQWDLGGKQERCNEIFSYKRQR
jgi:hypothetical protein